MGILDGLWHLLNFLAAPVGLGLIATVLARLVWRRRLAALAWRAVLQCVISACALAQLIGLVLSGHDGRMSTYALMVLACALALWWCALRPNESHKPHESGGA